MRGRLNNCHGPHSRQSYLGNLTFYGGHAGSSEANGIPGKGYFALIDTEKLCGEDTLDMLGMNVNGGKALNFFFKNLYVGEQASVQQGVHAAYVHLNYVKMVSTSSSGVLVEE